MTKTKEYEPAVGRKNHQFAGVTDICELAKELDKSRAERRLEAVKLGGWL